MAAALCWAVIAFIACVKASVPSEFLPMHARGGDMYNILVAKETEAHAAYGLNERNSTVNTFQQTIFHGDPNSVF